MSEEESKRLVQATTPPPPPDNDDVLGQFNEDALQNQSYKAEIFLILTLGVAVAAECQEIVIPNFLLPAAELQLCIQESRKGWLKSITLLAVGSGAPLWGFLADSIGRRKSLLLALTVATLFQISMPVMPTFSLFLTARFGSGFGMAGIFPIAFAYIAETTKKAWRNWSMGFVHMFWPLGALYCSLTFDLTMPKLGEEIVQDKREHWGGWHKFLMLCILPNLISIVLLLKVVPESPRFLLEASRDGEALKVYQKLYKTSKFVLTELELPKFPKNSIQISFTAFLGIIKLLFSGLYLKRTLILMAIHIILGFTITGLTEFQISSMKQWRQLEYFDKTVYLDNQTYRNHQFNQTLENVFYENCHIQNATFQRINLIHVKFQNCTIDRSRFINVKTSKFAFELSTITNSQFIDTDLTEHQFVNCKLSNNSFLSLISQCVVDFDYNIYLDDVKHTVFLGSIWMHISIVVITCFCLTKFPKPKLSAFLFSLDCQFTIATLLLNFTFVIFAILTTMLYVQLNLNVTIATIMTIEAFPCQFRCTAHGLFRSLFYLAGFLAVPLYEQLVGEGLIFFTLVTALPCTVGALVSLRMEDRTNVLL